VSTSGIIEAISHAISEPKPEAMLAGMHERLGIDPEAIRSGMPEAPAVTLYYTGGQFHAFWYDGLSEAHRARLQSHLDAHHRLGDLRALEGFYWAESLISGQPHLDHLDELKDFDLEARTIRWTLSQNLGREVADLLSEPGITDALAGIARREHIDIVMVCAWAASSWPYPAWISTPDQGIWRNPVAAREEMPAAEVHIDQENTYALRNHYFDGIRFCVALPVSLAQQEEQPASLEMLFAEDAVPALDGLFLTDFAEDSLDMLFAEAPQEVDGSAGLEMLFGGFPESPAPEKAAESISLESLFGEQSIQDMASLESLFAQPSAPPQAAAAPTLESLFEAPAQELPNIQPEVPAAKQEEIPAAKQEEVPATVVQQEAAPSLESLFGEPAVPEVLQPIQISPEPPATVAKTEVESSLESLFGELVSPPVLQPIHATPEIPTVEAKQEAQPSLEDLFGELPTLEIPQPLIVQPEVPVVEGKREEASLEDLFGGLASSEVAQPPHLAPEMPIAEAKSEAEPSLEDLFAIVPEISDETMLFGEVPTEEVLMSSLEALFEEEPANPEPAAPKSNFIRLMANAPEGAAIFAGALPLARKLEWICAESPEVIHGLLDEYLAQLECRVLYCPPQGMSRSALMVSLQGLPEQLALKVGFGLPEGHSLFLLTDAENNRIFYHQLPKETPAILVESWSETGAQEIDWRQQRFEMLWEDRLRPHVQVEPLSDNLENLFAIS
jgi:hypothetical protein